MIPVPSGNVKSFKKAANALELQGCRVALMPTALSASEHRTVSAAWNL